MATARAEGFAGAGGAVNLFSPQRHRITEKTLFANLCVRSDGRVILGVH